ncbi:NUDIX domain-containing protein [Candidatus Saccharibacteria bacterium]|nr:MAG: NUDIX domain-containing protein [Candidatus Saccharibacteria bacterium]
MTNSEQKPRVGIGVFIFRDGKFLMQQRRGSHGEGTWSIPGGHMEFGETPEQTAIREVREEIGCEIDNIRFAAVTNDFFDRERETKHYITWWVISDWKANEPRIVEPHKCTAQLWTDFDHLPEPLFLPWQNLLESEFLDGVKRELEKSRS